MESFKGLTVCYLADKHDLYDDRIYWKMAVPMQRIGAIVHYYLIGDREERGTTPEGIQFRIWKRKEFSKNPYLNFLIKRSDPRDNYKSILQAAADLRAEIYHLHGVWMNRIGPSLKQLPHLPAVFYDAREPYAEDYRSFYGANPLSRLAIDLFARWVDNWEKKQAAHYDMVISNEDTVRDQFSEVLGSSRAVTLYNYWYRAVPSAQEEPGEKQYDLIYCGLLNEQRGAFCLLEAVRAVKEQLPGIRVLILGKMDPKGLRSEIESYIENHELKSNIELISQVPYEKVSDFYLKSRIGLILWKQRPNLEIKLPIKIFEYMAFGLPVVGSDMGHIKKYIDEENCGITVDPEQPFAVANAIRELLTDEKLYGRMSDNGRRLCREQFDWKHEFDKLRMLYAEAIRQ